MRYKTVLKNGNVIDAFEVYESGDYSVSIQMNHDGSNTCNLITYKTSDIIELHMLYLTQDELLEIMNKEKRIRADTGDNVEETNKPVTEEVKAELATPVSEVMYC